MEYDPDDGHEHDFGLSDGFGAPLTDKATCLLCGVTIMSGYEFPIDWDSYIETPDQRKDSPPKPLRSTQPKKGTP